MTFSTGISIRPIWAIETLLFFKKHLAALLGLGSIAAIGRAAQLGAFGEIPPLADNALEVGIQSARILMFLYALGLTRVKNGITNLKQLVIVKANRKENIGTALTNVKQKWRSLMLSLIIYMLIAVVINQLIDYAAFQTCLYAKLKTHEIISAKSSEWVIILFFKNLSVIPFTLVFNALFFLWITDKLDVENRK